MGLCGITLRVVPCGTTDSTLSEIGYKTSSMKQYQEPLLNQDTRITIFSLIGIEGSDHHLFVQQINVVFCRSMIVSSDFEWLP